MAEIPDYFTPRNNEKLTFLMYFLPIFTTGYMYYQKYHPTYYSDDISFYLWLLIISSLVVIIKVSYLYAYLDTATPEHVQEIDAKIKKDKNIMSSINSTKPVAKWFIWFTLLWIILYVYVIVILFRFDDIITILMGIFQSGLMLLILLKTYFKIKIMKNETKFKD
jgi:hypothetical protein